MSVAVANTVVSTDLTAVREVDFVTRFAREIKIFREILGNIRMEKHAPGTKLTVKKAAVTLNTSSVGEGETIPYNAISYTETDVGSLTWDKQKIGVTMEAISAHGYDAAVQAADDDMLYKLRSKIVNDFFTFAQTGTLTSDIQTYDFQSALAEAQAQVQAKWEDMDRGYSDIIAFANVKDAYRYLGAAQITTQTAFGMTYIENFLGFSKLFLTSKIPQGKIVATPSQNLILYYVDATANDFNKAGFLFRTDNETNLIGVHVEGNHNTDVSELSTVMAMGLFSEYLDGIAVIAIEDVMPVLKVVSAEGSSSGKTAITVTGYTLGSGDSYKYKVTDDEIVVRKGGSTASGWTSWNGNAEITAATGKHIAIVVSNTNAVVAAGETTVTAKA